MTPQDVRDCLARQLADGYRVLVVGVRRAALPRELRHTSVLVWESSRTDVDVMPVPHDVVAVFFSRSGVSPYTRKRTLALATKGVNQVDVLRMGNMQALAAFLSPLLPRGEALKRACAEFTAREEARAPRVLAAQARQARRAGWVEVSPSAHFDPADTEDEPHGEEDADLALVAKEAQDLDSVFRYRVNVSEELREAERAQRESWSRRRRRGRPKKASVPDPFRNTGTER